tara:strand:- start:5 stop:205 length:201 start_codon:yes stop_codon:yes gene_type:complete
MYYISNFANDCAISVRKKRLGDFKGVEGERYHVRKRKSVEMFDFIPVYQVIGGKLKPTNQMSGLWL